MQEIKASQEHPAGSSASARVPGARQDMYQERTPPNEMGLSSLQVHAGNRRHCMYLASCLPLSHKASVHVEHKHVIAADGCIMIC